MMEAQTEFNKYEGVDSSSSLFGEALLDETSLGAVDDQSPRQRDRKGIALCVALMVMTTLSGLATISLEWWGFLEEHTLAENVSAVSIITFIAGIALSLVVPLTHGILGTSRHRSNGYSFYQPFVGGNTFVLLQFVGWTLYACTLITFGTCFYYVLMRTPLLGGLLASAGIGGIASQLCVLASIQYFDHRRRSVHLLGGRIIRSESVQVSRTFYQKLYRDVASFSITALLYQLPIVSALAITLPLLFLPLHYYFTAVALIVATYGRTYRGRPHRTGHRSWDLIRNNVNLFSLLEHYFNFKLVKAKDVEFYSNVNYMFCFHPHGIYPLTTIWSVRGKQWSNLFGNDLRIEVLGASVLFYLPLVRDFAMWSGSRDVTRESIQESFADGRSIMLVPGGEREMRESKPEAKEIYIITRHKGFVRIALQAGAPLVPMFSYGETRLLDNLRAKEIQEFFSKRMFYGMPHLPYGRWFTPIPNAVPLTLAVGKPLLLPKIPEPTQDEVDHYHTLYFRTLHAMFNEMKQHAPGYEEHTMILENFDANLMPTPRYHRVKPHG